MPKKPMTFPQATRLANELGIPQPIDLGQGLYGTVANVAPPMAETWIKKRNFGNRRPKKRSIHRYASDMEDGLWRLTHEGLGFTIRGRLCNGQNRLYAIIESGCTIPFLIVLGLQEDDGAFVDEGAIRSARDAAIITGHDATQSQLTTVKACYNGFTFLSEPISNPRSLKIAKHYTYKDGVEWLDKNLTVVKRVTTGATIRAAILRAYLYHCAHGTKESVDRLSVFCEVLGDGQFRGEKQANTAAVRLRDRMLATRLHGRRRESYGLTEKAIRHFLDRSPIVNLKPVTREMFPLDETTAPSRESELVTVE